MERDVLVAVDGSAQANEALEYALEQYPDADLTAIHVVDPADAVYDGSGVAPPESVLSVRTERAEAILDDAAATASDHGGTIDMETRVGNPAREIVAYAEREGVDHVVVGSHGRSGIERLLLGSVAERVVRRSSIPVTVVR